jgi:cysteine sulfinate desulfinase/cysteine desulfurase-like protein
MVREVGRHGGGASGDMRSGTPLLKAMETAAAADPDAAKLWEEHQQQRRIGRAGFTATLAAKTTLRYDDRTVADQPMGIDAGRISATRARGRVADRKVPDLAR